LSTEAASRTTADVTLNTALAGPQNRATNAEGTDHKFTTEINWQDHRLFVERKRQTKVSA
jgi:hypothetical protein